MSKLVERTVKVDANQYYLYANVNGFEMRKGFVRDYNYNVEKDPRLSEIRIRHDDHELIEVLYEKIKEWISDCKN